MAQYNILNTTPTTLNIRLIPVSKDFVLEGDDLEKLDTVGFVQGVSLKKGYAASCDNAISFATIDLTANAGSVTTITDGKETYTVNPGDDMAEVADVLTNDLGIKTTVLSKWNDPNT